MSRISLEKGLPGAPGADHGTLRILVADDDPDVLEFVARLLEGEGYEILRAANGAEAIDVAARRAPDLLVLDVSMPVLDGYAVCLEIQALGPAAPPVIFLTARAATQDRVVGLDAGAVDYVVKPFSGSELRARVRAALRSKVASDRLRAEAAIDPLTGLQNRNQLEPRVAQLVAAARRHQRPLACLMVDLDHFKAINDGHGHIAGDSVLVETARRLARVTRTADLLVRYGGDEFLLLLPDTARPGALVLADKVRETIGDPLIRYAPPSGPTLQLKIRASVGVSVLHDGMSGTDLLVAAADRALYEAKAGGRDRVCIDPRTDEAK